MANEGKLIQLQFPPGFARRGTPYGTMGRWREGNMARFDLDGSLRSVGGWLVMTLLNTLNDSVDLDGTPRSAFAWRDNLSRVWLAIGTTKKLYVWDGATIRDITPVGIVLPGETVGVVAGYGTGNYNTGDYNEPVGSSGASNSSAAKVYGYWHLDNWGENLVASIDSDGRIVEWNPNTPATVAAVVTNAPEYALGVGATNERHLVVLGAKVALGGGAFRPAPRRVQWSSQEDNTVYAATPTNTAGELELQTEGVGLRVFKFRTETLIFTDADVHRMVYLGYPDVYRLEKIAGDCGLACPGAVAASNNVVFWVGPRGFYLYDGNQVTPLDCELFDTAGEGAALISRNAKLSVGHNKQFNEFQIHYATTPTGNPDRYIAYNYVSGWWTDGALDRSVWYDSHLLDYPIAAQPFTSGSDPKARLYKHELGASRSNYNEVDYAESAPLEISDGDRFLEIDRVLQDSDLNDSNRLRVSYSFYKAPNTDPIKETTPVALSSRGYTDARGTGRAMSIRIETANANGGRWRVGKWRARIAEGARR